MNTMELATTLIGFLSDKIVNELSDEYSSNVISFTWNFTEERGIQIIDYLPMLAIVEDYEISLNVDISKMQIGITVEYDFKKLQLNIAPFIYGPFIGNDFKVVWNLSKIGIDHDLLLEFVYKEFCKRLTDRAVKENNKMLLNTLHIAAENFVSSAMFNEKNNR